MSDDCVLIVEDDHHLARAWSLRLKAAGLRTQVAPDAYHARRLARSEPFRVIVLDLKIPAGDGFQLHEELLDLQPDPFEVIYVTGSDCPDLADRASKLGAHSVFRKPLDMDAFLAAVHECVATGKRAAV
ncbi:MAG: response regulator [Phycisphaerales bacterium]|nr:response regulator [Phycisphaerales bacterium]